MTSQYLAPWMDRALAEVGVGEVTGPASNPRILEYAATTMLHATSDEVPWCSSFACWVFEEYGVTSPKSARARDWLSWGLTIKTPIYGCIVIFDRGHGMGHVGLFAGYDGQRLRILGGNQTDRVCIETFGNAKVLGYRWPEHK